MLTFSKLKSSSIEQGKRILKVFQFGAKTAKESSPFGFDSSAPENWTAIFGETSNKGESVIIGYINKNQLAEVGSSRIYAVGSSGEVVGVCAFKGFGSSGVERIGFFGGQIPAAQKCHRCEGHTSGR